MNVQIASDLHLEFYTNHKSPLDLFDTLLTYDGADVLILAGDIGYPELLITRQFFEWVCSKWPRVLWVFGNHEYYNKRPVSDKHYGATILSMEDKEAWIESYTTRHPSLTVLQNSSKTYPEFPDYTFLGTTLWTGYPPYGFNDFNYIPFTKNDWTSLHTQARRFLEESLAIPGKKIVITHHMPTFDMIAPHYKGSPQNHGFAANCDDLMSHPNVCLWVCGHSHGHRTIQEPCLCVMNARGYPKESSILSYNPSYTVTTSSPLLSKC